MKFIVKRPKENILTLMRKLLYSPHGQNEENGELIFTRFLGPSGYPRFHLYIKEENDNLIFNLHLDQKRPSYQGATAHNAEYEGDTVKTEANRIRQGIK